MLNAMNYSRNAGFYEEIGQGGFWELVLEAVAYLGSPVQVSISVANHMAAVGDLTDYRDYTDIELELTTNSVFADAFVTGGYVGLVSFAVNIFFWSLVLGYLSQYQGSYLMVPAGSIMYAFSEIWRIDMFSGGYFLTLFLSSTAVSVAFAMVFSLVSSHKSR